MFCLRRKFETLLFEVKHLNLYFYLKVTAYMTHGTFSI